MLQSDYSSKERAKKAAAAGLPPSAAAAAAAAALAREAAPAEVQVTVAVLGHQGQESHRGWGNSWSTLEVSFFFELVGSFEDWTQGFWTPGSGKSTLVGALMLATGAINERDLVKRRKDQLYQRVDLRNSVQFCLVSDHLRLNFCHIDASWYTHQKHPKASRSIQKHPEASRSIQKHQRAPRTPWHFWDNFFLHKHFRRTWNASPAKRCNVRMASVHLVGRSLLFWMCLEAARQENRREWIWSTRIRFSMI